MALGAVVSVLELEKHGEVIVKSIKNKIICFILTPEIQVKLALLFHFDK
jgi:hypothetical protein